MQKLFHATCTQHRTFYYPLQAGPAYSSCTHVSESCSMLRRTPSMLKKLSPRFHSCACKLGVLHTVAHHSCKAASMWCVFPAGP